MKFGQLIEIFFVKNNAQNEARKLVPGLFLFLKKLLHEAKASDLQLSFNIRPYSLT